MKINEIILENFGSYEGKAVFDTKTTEDKNIILIGGKNGAGKTTLFTAIRLCIYGYMSMGYKNANAYYTKSIIKLINNAAKISKPVKAMISINVSIENSQEVDEYVIVRSWIYTDTLIEIFSVTKNGEELNYDEVFDFEKYIINLIPLELFNLYFFDGERIADFFLEEGSNINLRSAFLILCGYDIFDIMSKNFKRLSQSVKKEDANIDKYIHEKENYENLLNTLKEKENTLSECNISIKNCESDLSTLDINYSRKGGITQEVWQEKIELLKSEERKRIDLNNDLKRWTNEIIPFAIIKEQLLNLKRQIQYEQEMSKFLSFKEIMHLPQVSDIIDGVDCVNKDTLFRQIDSYIDTLIEEKGNKQLLDLSYEDNINISNIISRTINFDLKQIKSTKRKIKKSIETSSNIRMQLANSSIDGINDYNTKKMHLLENKNNLLQMKNQLEKEASSYVEMTNEAYNKFTSIKNDLEDALKKQSISEITTKAIIMLDKLQNQLYMNKIHEIEILFQKQINKLISKNNFIDYIKIDEDFFIHIYKYGEVFISELLNLIKNYSEKEILNTIGNQAYDELKEYAETNKKEGIIEYLKQTQQKSITLSLEINKTSLSNGEKQIFIMTLYHSLIKLYDREIPFIIDTPFARIDKKNRNSIAKNYFSNLRGQIFILSTDEEIDYSHIKILKDKIAYTYMLENDDNKRTKIFSNTYFGGKKIV